MRWNSVLDMFARLLELHWPVVIVLSDRSLTNLSDAKALDMKEEHWMLMADLVPLLRPLQIATSLLSAAESPSPSAVFPTVWRLINVDMAGKEEASPAVKDFKVKQ